MTEEPAYYLSWTSVYRKPIRAALFHRSPTDAWRTVLSWDVYRIGSGRRRMMQALLTDLGRPLDPVVVGYLHTKFEHHLRITDRDLAAALDDGVPVPLFPEE